jgi:hypothetical protein
LLVTEFIATHDPLPEAITNIANHFDIPAQITCARVNTADQLEDRIVNEVLPIKLLIAQFI